MSQLEIVVLVDHSIDAFAIATIVFDCVASKDPEGADNAMKLCANQSQVLSWINFSYEVLSYRSLHL